MIIFKREGLWVLWFEGNEILSSYFRSEVESKREEMLREQEGWKWVA